MKNVLKKPLAEFTAQLITPQQQCLVKGGDDFIGATDIVEG